jgi:CBS domain-containing protein
MREPGARGRPVTLGQPRRIADMNIASILARKGTQVVTIRPAESIRDAVRLMARHNIGGLVVVDGSQPVGMLTERDVMREAARDELVFGRRVDALMTRDVVIGSPADDLMSVAHTMTERRFRHLPVMQGGALVGIVTIGDVLKAERDRYQGEVETLQTQLQAGPA